MDAATTISSGIQLSLAPSNHSFVYTFVGFNGNFDPLVTQMQDLAEPPFIESDLVMQDAFQDMIDQTASGANQTVGVYVNARSCVKTSEDFLSGVAGNCTEICADDATLFLPYNLNTCLTLSAVAMLVQNDYVTYVQDHTAFEMAAEVGNGSTWDGTGILDKVKTCVVDACSQHNLSTCPQETLDLNQTSTTVEALPSILSALAGFCNETGLQVNSDMAGPGVMVSYLLQVSAALFFWLLIKVLTSWPRALSWPVYLSLYWTQKNRRRPTVPGFDPNLSPPAPYDNFKEPPLPGRRRSAWIQANDVQDRLIRLRLHAATVSTLVEFHEVQAFFIGAIQVATLGSLAQSLSANSARSFGEAILNSQVVQVLAVSGLSPLLLVQCLLQRYGMRWWYTFGLLWVTIALAVVVSAKRGKLLHKFDALWDNFTQNSPVASCGGLANPMVYCDTDSMFWETSTLESVELYFAVAMLTIDFLAPILKRLRPIKAALSLLAILEEQSRVYAWLRRKLWPILLQVLWFVLEYSLVVLVAVYFQTLLTITITMNSGTNTWGLWTFGQLISVMVWVPLLFKFVYYNIL